MIAPATSSATVTIHEIRARDTPGIVLDRPDRALWYGRPGFFSTTPEE